MAPRRSSAAVTRDYALSVSDLLIKSGVSLTTLAALLNQPSSTLTGWMIRGIRPSQKIMRDSVSLLKRIIDLRESNPRLSLTNTQSLKKVLESQPQADHREIRSAYFTPAPKDRTRGSVLVTTMDGKVMEYKTTRAAFHRWEQSGFHFSAAPQEVYFKEE